MTTLIKPYIHVKDTKIMASFCNADYDTLYDDYNGSIDNDNIKAAAAIEDSKLSQITTADKVSGSALTLLTSFAALAGVIPAVNLPPYGKMGTFTRDMTLDTGDVDYTSVGFTPTNIIFIASIPGAASIGSIGFDDGTSHYVAYVDTIPAYYMTTLFSIAIFSGAADSQAAKIKNFLSNGFTLTWTKGNSPTGTATVYYIAF